MIMAKCSYTAKQYKLTTVHCEKAAELFDCRSHLPYELWAMALHKSGQFQASINKLEFAKECVQDLQKQRHLQKYMDDVRKEMIAKTQRVSSEPDADWLVGTNVHTTQQQQAHAQEARNAHVKKKKRVRPKRVAEHVTLSPNDWLNGASAGSQHAAGDRSQNGVTTSDPAYLDAYNNQLLKYTSWDTSSEDDSSDLEDAVKIPMDHSDEKEPVVTKVKAVTSDKTWFEDSQEMYENGEQDNRIVCGMSMNVDINTIVAKGMEQKRAPFYRNMEPVYQLEKWMKTMPEQYKRCRIELESAHKAICKVLSSDHGEIEIHGRSKCGQTFNHDEVCVEILSKPNSILAEKTEGNNKIYGRVVGVLSTNFREDQHPVLACTCDDDEGFLMHPLCKSVPKIHALNGRTKKKYPSLSKYRIDTYTIDDNGQLQFKRYFDVKPGLRGRYVFLVVYLTWGMQHVYPLGAVIDVLECGTDYNGGIEILEMQHGVPSKYSRETVKHIEDLLKEKNLKTSDDRVDCRDLIVFTIDPQNSKDLDDALSICKEDDHFIVGVHIADVAAIVKKGDPADTEAKRRATSYYPTDSKVRHMLPEPLSENLCSLLPKEERCTISVFFQIDKSGNVKKASVKKTLIKSCQKLSYEEAQKVIDGEVVESVPDNIRENIRLLHEIAEKIREDRMKNSRYAVPFEDSRFLENDAVQETVEAHALVEEFMIKANTSIAAWLRKKYPTCIPIRCQPEPSQEELQNFVQTEEKFLDLVVNLQGREVLPARRVAAENMVAKGNTVKKEYLPVQKNIWLQILEGVHDGKMKDAMKTLCKDEVHPFQAVALDHWRSIMDTAEYRCSEMSEKDLSHFSLQTKLYTHFTSPIRRYVDLVVHRLVHAALEDQPCPYTSSEIAEMCANVNNASSRQKNFSHGCQALKRSEKFAREPMTFDAFITSVNDSGAELCIPSLKHISDRSKELPFNLLHFSKKPDENQDTHSTKMLVWGKWNKRIYDLTGCPSQLAYSKRIEKQRKKPKIIVNPNQHVYFVDSQTWAKMLKACFTNDQTYLKKILRKQPEEGFDPPNGHPVRDIVTAEVGDGTIKSLQCKFDYCFAPGRVVKVQMVANPVQGILTPQVRLLHVSKNLTLCMSHMEDPVAVLSKYATETTKKNIASVAEYKRLWMPLLEMEAATSAVCSEGNFIINNVKLQFRRNKVKTRTLYKGEFTLPSKFINERCIEFGGKSLEKIKDTDDDCDEDVFDVSSVDYICIRCPVHHSESGSETSVNQDKLKATSPLQRSSKDVSKKKDSEELIAKDICTQLLCSSQNTYTWVGHGQVLKVRRKNKKDRDLDQVTVTFSLNANSAVVPEAIFPTTTGTVEVIVKSEVDRRTMRMLNLLNGEKTDLATCIALHRKSPRLDKDRFDYGKKMEKEVPIPGLPPNNTKQHEAIDRALSSSFSLIQGPPGTGKTYTGVKLVYLFDKINKFLHLEQVDTQKKQVLFCGPSNKAVDLVARQLLQKLGQDCPRIIRMYGSNIVSQDYPVPKRHFISKGSMRDLKSDQYLYRVTLHHMIRQRGKPHAEEIQMFDDLFRTDPEAVTPRHVRKYGKLVYTAACEELSKCDVILCTCAVAGTKKLTQSTRIFQCIIDECGMCPEPQSMIPIIATKAKQVVLIGDHKQLRPIIKCKQAAELGLEQSLFERFATQATLLNMQYRMHPRLCDFPSETFYDGKLETAPSLAWGSGDPLRLWPIKDIPHVLCHVEGTEEILSVTAEEGNEQSRSNKAEVDKVLEVFRWLVEKEDVNPRYINIMSQYNAQCTKIREALGRYCSHYKYNVNTVVASQGGEWDYIIFSTVRSLPEYKIEKSPTLGWMKHNLGFITDANQVNVALTRAHKGLIIIGNQNLLRSDDIFKKLIEKYERQGCVVDASEFPRRYGQNNKRRRAQNPGADWSQV